MLFKSATKYNKILQSLALLQNDKLIEKKCLNQFDFPSWFFSNETGAFSVLCSPVVLDLLPS